MRVDAFGGAKVQDVLSQANQMGYKAEISKLEPALAESSWPALAKDRLSQSVILITKSENSPLTLQLKLDVKTQSLSSSYISLIDAGSKKLITDFEISSFSAEK
jgi:hypothetical protein